MRQKIKLHTVNVIEMTNGEFQAIRSFADSPKGNKQAEKLFRRLVREYEKDYPEQQSNKQDLENYLDDGIYEHGNTLSGYQLIISHSV
jgi:hypothetical protein